MLDGVEKPPSVYTERSFFACEWLMNCAIVLNGATGRTAPQEEKALLIWPRTISRGCCSAEKQLNRVCGPSSQVHRPMCCVDSVTEGW